MHLHSGMLPLAVDSQLFYVAIMYPGCRDICHEKVWLLCRSAMKRAWLSAGCMHEVHSALQPTGKAAQLFSSPHNALHSTSYRIHDLLVINPHSYD